MAAAVAVDVGGHRAVEGSAPPEEFAFVELFAGIGGFRLGLQALNGRCVFASEMDPFAAETYRVNFGEAPAGDILTIDASSIPSHDILTAGFPCQPFTGLGDRTGLQGTPGARGMMFWEVYRVAALHRPCAIFLENVAGLLKTNEGDDWRTIHAALTQLGYSVHHDIVNAVHFVPQCDPAAPEAPEPSSAGFVRANRE